jgi:hypothetical protein
MAILASRLHPGGSMTCTYCGLPTDGGRNHGTAEGCVHALEAETRRLRDGVQSMRPAAGQETKVWKIGPPQAVNEPPARSFR